MIVIEYSGKKEKIRKLMKSISDIHFEFKLFHIKSFHYSLYTTISLKFYKEKKKNVYLIRLIKEKNFSNSELKYYNEINRNNYNGRNINKKV